MKITMLITMIVIVQILGNSCTKQKQYIENAKCRRFLEVSDKFDENMNYLKTDTLWPLGRIANYACGQDLDSLLAYKPHIEGCSGGGYQQFRYIIK